MIFAAIGREGRQDISQTNFPFYDFLIEGHTWKPGRDPRRGVFSRILASGMHTTIGENVLIELRNI